MRTPAEKMVNIFENNIQVKSDATPLKNQKLTEQL